MRSSNPTIQKAQKALKIKIIIFLKLQTFILRLIIKTEAIINPKKKDHIYSGYTFNKKDTSLAKDKIAITNPAPNGIIKSKGIDVKAFLNLPLKIILKKSPLKKRIVSINF
jgi:hypothetical protein